MSICIMQFCVQRWHLWCTHVFNVGKRDAFSSPT